MTEWKVRGTIGAWVLVLAGAMPSIGRAQVGALPIDQLDSAYARHSPAPLGGPGEMYWDTQFDALMRTQAVPMDAAHYPRRMLDSATRVRARVWLDSLRGPVRGVGLVAQAQLAVAAGDAAGAQASFRAWLATPGLSLEDRIATLASAAAAFTDPWHPERAPIVLEYLRQLAALGSVARAEEMTGRLDLLSVYDRERQWAEVAAEGRRIYTLLKESPYWRQADFAANGRGTWLHLVVAQGMLEMRSGAAGRAVVDSLTAALQAQARAAAADSQAAGDGVEWQRAVRAESLFIAVLGRPAPRVVGNLWMNTADTTAHTQALDDGIAHVLVFCEDACTGGQLPAAQVLQRRLVSTAQVILLPTFVGSWGYRFVPTQEELQLVVERYRHFGVTVPVAFWVAKKTLQPDGGMLPPMPNPNFAAYHVDTQKIDGGVVVVDRRGIVRRRYGGIGGSNMEDVAAYVLGLGAPGSHGAAVGAGR